MTNHRLVGAGVSVRSNRVSGVFSVSWWTLLIVVLSSRMHNNNNHVANAQGVSLTSPPADTSKRTFLDPFHITLEPLSQDLTYQEQLLVRYEVEQVLADYLMGGSAAGGYEWPSTISVIFVAVARILDYIPLTMTSLDDGTSGSTSSTSTATTTTMTGVVLTMDGVVYYADASQSIPTSDDLLPLVAAALRPESLVPALQKHFPAITDVTLNQVTTPSPTEMPTTSPTMAPTRSPTPLPTQTPTTSPTLSPTFTPTTSSPTSLPTSSPTSSPTALPTSSPTLSPTASPTALPTSSPTFSPTGTPTVSPTTQSPTASPVDVSLTSPPVAAETTTTDPTMVPTVPAEAAPATVAPTAVSSSGISSTTTAAPSTATTTATTTAAPSTTASDATEGASPTSVAGAVSGPDSNLLQAGDGSATTTSTGTLVGGVVGGLFVALLAGMFVARRRRGGGGGQSPYKSQKDDEDADIDVDVDVDKLDKVVAETDDQKGTREGAKDLAAAAAAAGLPVGTTFAQQYEPSPAKTQNTTTMEDDSIDKNNDDEKAVIPTTTTKSMGSGGNDGLDKDHDDDQDSSTAGGGDSSLKGLGILGALGGFGMGFGAVSKKKAQQQHDDDDEDDDLPPHLAMTDGSGAEDDSDDAEEEMESELDAMEQQQGSTEPAAAAAGGDSTQNGPKNSGNKKTNIFRGLWNRRAATASPAAESMMGSSYGDGGAATVHSVESFEQHRRLQHTHVLRKDMLESPDLSAAPLADYRTGQALAAAAADEDRYNCALAPTDVSAATLALKVRAEGDEEDGLVDNDAVYYGDDDGSAKQQAPKRQAPGPAPLKSTSLAKRELQEATAGFNGIFNTFWGKQRAAAGPPQSRRSTTTTKTNGGAAGGLGGMVRTNDDGDGDEEDSTFDNVAGDWDPEDEETSQSDLESNPDVFATIVDNKDEQSLLNHSLKNESYKLQRLRTPPPPPSSVQSQRRPQVKLAPVAPRESSSSGPIRHVDTGEGDSSTDGDYML